jgi:hypothetical protein
LEVPGNQEGSVKLRIALRNPTLRKYSFRFTFFPRGTGEIRRAWVETEEELTSIR